MALRTFIEVLVVSGVGSILTYFGLKHLFEFLPKWSIAAKFLSATITFALFVLFCLYSYFTRVDLEQLTIDFVGGVFCAIAPVDECKRRESLSDKDEDDWKIAVRGDTITSFDIYMERHPRGKHIIEAKSKIAELSMANDDSLSWEIARKIGSLVSYFKYIADHPLGRYVADAQKRIEILHEEGAWQIATVENSTAGYQKYIHDFPGGRNVSEARNRILSLQEEDAWRMALRANTTSKFQKFINEFPGSRYFGMAKSNIQSLHDDEGWQQARSLNTHQSYLNYLEAFPDGKYRTQANQLAEALESEPPAPAPKALRRRQQRYKLAGYCNSNGQQVQLCDQEFIQEI